MVGGLITTTLFTLLALPTFCLLIRRWQSRWAVKPAASVVEATP